MIVIQEKKVIKISADFARGFDCGINVELRSIGKSGKEFRQNAHLDVTGNGQFAFNPLLGSGCLPEIDDVLLERSLHENEGFRQFANFIPVFCSQLLNLGQLCLR